MAGEELVPGIDDALKAASTRGYESILIVMFFVTVLGFLVWLVRQWLSDSVKREERMAKRIDELEQFIRTEMLKALERNSQALAALTDVLHDRPCLANSKT